MVLLLSLGGVIGSNFMWQEFLVLVYLATLSLRILVYGKIVSRLVPGMGSSTWTILKDNGLNFVIAVAILGVPQGALRFLVASRFDTYVVNVVAATLLASLFGVLMIYVLPIVFLKKSSLAAVLAGVTYLWRNLAASMWIAGLVVVVFLLTTTGALVFRMETTGWSFALVLVTSFVGYFLSFVTFSAALQKLLEGSE